MEPSPFQNWPFVSIVVPVYNGAETIEKCLDSLLHLDYPHFDIWVLNDCSTDDTTRLVQQYFPKVHLHQNDKRRGFGASLNRGIRLTKGEVSAFVNVDAWVDSQWLKELVFVLSSHSNVGVVGSKIFDPDGETLQHTGAYIAASGFTQHFGRGEREIEKYNTVRDCDYVCGAAVAFRRNVFETLGGFDERFYPCYFEDVDLCAQLRERGYQVLYVPKAVVWHCENITWGKASRGYFYHYNKNRLQFVFKWLVKRNGFFKQIQLEWDIFRKPWPYGFRFVWIGAFFSAIVRTVTFLMTDKVSDYKKQQPSTLHEHLSYVNHSYDPFILPKKGLFKNWLRRLVARVIGYYVVRQRDFNVSVVCICNDFHQRLERIELQQKQVHEELQNLNSQMSKIQKRQEALLNYLSSSFESLCKEKEEILKEK